MTNNACRDLFITDIEQIIDVLDESKEIYLYDTVAISHHELLFHRDGENILKDFITKDDPIVITETIKNEIRIAEDADGRYTSYLKALGNKVILIKEEDFFKLVEGNFKPKEKAKGKFKACCKKAFQTIQPLVEACDTISNNDPASVLELFQETFVSGKNKGEYWLLWLSCILKITNPTLRINFIGVDRDLYYIVDHCYFQEKVNPDQGVQILSADSIVQALYRTNFNKDQLIRLSHLYRQEDRKLLYQGFRKGILEKQISQNIISNERFITSTIKNEMVVVY